MKSDLLGELSRKRAVPPPDNDAVKRLKMEQQQQQQQQNQQQQQQVMVTPTATPPPVAPPPQDVKGPMSYAELYTLSTDVAMTSFDGQQLPLDLVLQIIVGSIYSMNQHNLDVAITVRASFKYTSFYLFFFINQSAPGREESTQCALALFPCHCRASTINPRNSGHGIISR